VQIIWLELNLKIILTEQDFCALDDFWFEIEKFVKIAKLYLNTQFLVPHRC